MRVCDDMPLLTMGNADHWHTSLLTTNGVIKECPLMVGWNQGERYVIPFIRGQNFLYFDFSNNGKIKRGYLQRHHVHSRSALRGSSNQW